MLVVILGALVPVFFGLALGYLAGWTRDVDNSHVAGLNAMVMDFAIPAAIFATVAQASRATLLAQAPLAAILCLSMLLLYGAVYLMAWKVARVTAGEAAVEACTTSLPNYAAAGLPLIASLLGPANVVSVAVSIACGAIVVSPLTLVILEATAHKSDKADFAGVLLHAFRKAIW